MKAQIFLTLFVVFFSISALAERPVPELVKSEIEKLYVPNGFDSNDKAQVVIDSYLSNPCYKVGPTKVKRDMANRVIHIEQWVYRYPGMICPQVIVPFSVVLDLGILEANSYDIRDATSERKIGQIDVRRSTNEGPDDHFYAPVTDARVDVKNRKVNLNGVFTNSCLEIQEVKAFRDPKNVVIVLPILKPWKEGSARCKAGRYPFQATVDLPALEAGRYLLHVRSMNGQAVNKLFDTYGEIE